MDDGRLDVVQTRSHITALPEIGVLIDSTRNEAGNLGGFLRVRAKNEGEASSEGRGRLFCWEGSFAQIISVT